MKPYKTHIQEIAGTRESLKEARKDPIQQSVVAEPFEFIKGFIMQLPTSLRESTEGQDTVTMDVPLMIRLFELMREDVKSDVDLHNVAERILGMANQGTLTMDNYEAIAGNMAKPEAPASADNPAELDELRKLSGI